MIRSIRWRPALLVVLLLLAAHAAWDYLEARRLFQAIDALRTAGEPVSRLDLGQWKRPTDPDEMLAARYYDAAGALAYRDWVVSQPVANLPSAEPIRRARIDFEAVAASGRLTDEISSRFEQLRQEFADALAMADRAADLPFSSFPPHVFEDYPRTYSLENLTLPASARTILLAFAGDGDGAARSLYSSLKLRRAHVRRVPWVGDPLIDLQLVLERARPSAALLEQLQQAYAERERPDAIERELRASRARLIESVLGDLYGRQADPHAPHIRVVWAPLMPWRPWLAGQLRQSLRLQQEVIEAARQAWPARLEALASRTSPTPLSRRWFEPQQVWYARNLPRLADGKATAIDLARVRAARVALAVARYQAANAGRLPESADQLVPAFLESVPQDPFTGQPLRFHADAERYVVYSDGPDKRDDGGDVRPIKLMARLVNTKDVGIEVRR